MKPLHVAGLLALIFVAGFVGGAVVTDIIETRAMRHAVAQAVEHPIQTRTNLEINIDLKLEHRLNLGPGQRNQVHRILKDAREKMHTVREDFQPKLNAISLEARTNIYSVLRPNQQDSFAAFLEDNRQFLAVRELPPQRPTNAAIEQTNSPPQ
ncbi:MAG TPA: hypothetical protein VKV04_16680 [Verrucomicrobiae bacterium]|nr:hypothetical protein [Verrucomicrobiae bacterium]